MVEHSPKILANEENITTISSSSCPCSSQPVVVFAATHSVIPVSFTTFNSTSTHLDVWLHQAFDATLKRGSSSILHRRVLGVRGDQLGLGANLICNSQYRQPHHLCMQHTPLFSTLVDIFTFLFPPLPGSKCAASL